jgi:hypothetical protein
MTKTIEVTAALRERFAPPEFALFEEVGDSGSSSRVYADGVAINMWASRGYAIHGFEVKVSRSDWLRELKQPDKAEPIITKCDHFWLVAPDEVYQIDEVPPSWGILGFKDGKLREKRKAPALDPKPITRAFVAQMFRRSSDREVRNIQDLIDKALRDERAKINARIEEGVKYKTRELNELAAKWKRVEEACGERWLSDLEVIEAVKIVMKSDVCSTYSGLREISQRLLHAHERIEKAFAHLKVEEPAA